MRRRAKIIIDGSKSKEFYAEMTKHAANKEYWENVKRVASTPIDKEALKKAYGK